MTSQESDNELSKLLYCAINLLMIGLGVLLVCRVFVVFGAFGVCGYLGYLASTVFRDSLMFPVALTAIGFGVVYLGILWQRHEHSITQRVRQRLPVPMQEFLKSKDLSR